MNPNLTLEIMRGAFSPNANLAQSTCQSFEAAGKFCQQYFMQYLTQQRTFEVALIIMIMVMIWWQIYFIKQKPLIAANMELYSRLKKMGVEQPAKPILTPHQLINEKIKMPKLDGIDWEIKKD